MQPLGKKFFYYSQFCAMIIMYRYAPMKNISRKGMPLAHYLLLRKIHYCLNIKELL